LLDGDSTARKAAEDFEDSAEESEKIHVVFPYVTIRDRRVPRPLLATRMPGMNFTRVTLPASRLSSLAWDRDDLVDWVGGARYHLDGRCEPMNVGSAYRFDAAVGFEGLAVQFEALGTKGLVIRDNGQRARPGYFPASVNIIREIDRSYYHADDYWFPVTLFAGADGRTLLAHCPRQYNVIDIDDPAGTCLTPRPVEGAADYFHSRLEASTDGRWLLSNGWVWHPWGVACVYDVARAIEDPPYLSTSGEQLELGDAWDWQVDAATFVGDRILCVNNDEKRALSIFDLRRRKHECLIELNEAPGTRVMALGDEHIVLFDGHPRVVSVSDGRIVERWDDLDGGEGLHQPSVAMKGPSPPWLACDTRRCRFALGYTDSIVVVSCSI
jgi:hypothetical protein